jgi:AraC-like DNA-binding protein
MSQRMSATERRAQLLTIMKEMHENAQSQADFTAAKIAQATGISTVMLYRLVRAEFQTLRSELPGSRRPADEVMRTLRLENADLRRQLKEAREKLRTTIMDPEIWTGKGLEIRYTKA